MLTLAVGALLRSTLKNRPCRVTPELLVRISQGGAFLYPDITVTRGEMKLADDRKDVLLNPTAIVEVLSKSTEAYDRGRKFSFYRQIESVQEYILVSQSEPRIETFLRQPDGGWRNLSEWTLPACAGASIARFRSRRFTTGYRSQPNSPYFAAAITSTAKLPSTDAIPSNGIAVTGPAVVRSLRACSPARADSG
jgi:hypothetical protein